MLRIFFKLYTFMYLRYLKIIFRGRLVLRGRVKANRFFRIELSKDAKLIILGDIVLKENILIAARKNAEITIGKDCFFNRNCSIVARESIVIGEGSMFGEGVKIYDNNHLIRNGKVSRDKFMTAKLSIGSYCWIANDVNLLMGTVIPSNSTIAAMSLVNSRLEKPGIYAGIPAQFKKEL